MHKQNCMHIRFVYRLRFMVFNATFNNISVISWRSVLLVEETGVPGENHRPIGSKWRTLSTGTCFLQKIYAPSSSLLQCRHLPFTPSPLRLNIFRLFVILSLTQLYRYTPEIFLFSTATFKYTYRAPLRRIGQEYSAKVAFSIFQSLKRIQPLPVCAEFFIYIRNSLDRPCVTMPSWLSPLKCKVSLWNTDNCSNAEYKNSKLLTFDF
jgi:hypothetical protein